ncbi:hypothetical protein [Streptomyces spiramenti]|uniref:Uncharacterized protein n=1 Tax=Streptomyces spiramenti TaxID=2720606 RepID=A0ABX1AMZ6_9ACTN|nr:hypothetical protein [Streptomyces spiramenti]NJP68468.1 hypothetical protein [Streptomyces spiramenti]
MPRTLTTLSFAAFCGYRRGAYLDYATLRLGSPRAGRIVVDATFADLAREWGRVISSESPAAAAWRFLTSRTELAVQAGRDGRPAARRPRLSARHADALSLVHCLRLSTDEAADLIGVPRTRLLADLRAAERRLAPEGHSCGIFQP